MYNYFSFLNLINKISHIINIGKLSISHIVKYQNIYHICTSGCLKNISVNNLNTEYKIKNREAICHFFNIHLIYNKLSIVNKTSHSKKDSKSGEGKYQTQSLDTANNQL
ncbi:hypothetical protein GW891_05030 [bacterium]|nr:hypothetical protein [bacterium]